MDSLFRLRHRLRVSCFFTIRPSECGALSFGTNCHLYIFFGHSLNSTVKWRAGGSRIVQSDITNTGYFLYHPDLIDFLNFLSEDSSLWLYLWFYFLCCILLYRCDLEHKKDCYFFRTEFVITQTVKVPMSDRQASFRHFLAINICLIHLLYCRPVGAKGSIVPPDFVRSVNSISTSGADYADNVTTWPPDF